MDIKKNKVGRPTNYTAALAKEICDVIASNSIGIKKLCAENPHWPNKDTIFAWLKNNSEFSDQYAQAKQCQVELLVEEILEIADDSSHDEVVNEQGNIICNREFIARSRLRIDTRKWLASKLVPKIYGARCKEEQAPVSSYLEKLLGLN
ncbi:Uncharacterised protein [Legionella steigerwaltii]|uniref:Terminase small subunit n=1 Tax=Legionella steigerwaltii TaxID=460 RepID=A0A378LFE9_9GAMM|nr:hypothetical protein [Legionella steigerwaltii]KTD79513.1 hypothetical protein Lstg_0729 [Legionella steigerwaltii]STY24602.1 Uncharacterised protein [Legionella steigerwaltii]